MSDCFNYLKSSIGKKQVVATTGLALILFIIGHLAGNLLLILGPDAYNGYAHKLASLRPALYVVEAGLALIFLIHIFFTYLVILENRNARPQRYNTFDPSEQRSLATKLMFVSGTLIAAFVVIHLLDFTFVDHEGPKSVLPNGAALGLYGVVYNAFIDVPHSMFYIAVMMSLGLHLCHGIESFFQTFGFGKGPTLSKVSRALGFGIALLYSSIPIYVMIHNYLGTR